MSNFPRVRPAGWGTDVELASAEMNALDIAHTKAPNADEGSTHAPSADIILTGSFGLSADTIRARGTNRVLVGTRSLPRLLRTPLIAATGAEDKKAVRVGGLIVPSVDYYQVLEVPDSSELTGVAISIDSAAIVTPSAGNKIKMQLSRTTFATGASVSIFSSFEDPLVEGTGYRDQHVFTKSPISEVINNATTIYILKISGETGGDSANVTWYGTQVTFAPISYDDGAS